MEHVVFFPGPNGAPGFHRFSSLEEALGFVEHMRNVEGVLDVSVHALTPVPVSFRAYYKVEVPAQSAAVEEPAESGVEPAVEPELEPVGDVLAEPVGAAAANGERSMGFFAH